VQVSRVSLHRQHDRLLELCGVLRHVRCPLLRLPIWNRARRLLDDGRHHVHNCNQPLLPSGLQEASDERSNFQALGDLQQVHSADNQHFRLHFQLQSVPTAVLQILRGKALRRAIRKFVQVLLASEPRQFHSPAVGETHLHGGVHLRTLLRVLGLLTPDRVL